MAHPYNLRSSGQANGNWIGQEGNVPGSPARSIAGPPRPAAGNPGSPAPGTPGRYQGSPAPFMRSPFGGPPSPAPSLSPFRPQQRPGQVEPRLVIPRRLGANLSQEVLQQLPLVSSSYRYELQNNSGVWDHFRYIPPPPPVEVFCAYCGKLKLRHTVRCANHIQVCNCAPDHAKDQMRRHY